MVMVFHTITSMEDFTGITMKNKFITSKIVKLTRLSILPSVETHKKS